MVCRGNARRLGLRLKGRKSSLGSILGKRSNPWLSGTCLSLTTMLRCNTHTAPTYRLPLLPDTHDPCWKRQSANTHPKKLARAMSRATARATRYCTSYIQKGQPAGKREVARALRNLDFLEASLSKEEAVKQFMRTANRVLLNIQFKGAVRPTTEEFRLAA